MNAPLVLLYNLDNRNGSRLRLICLKLHIRVRTVAPAELAEPVGALAGLMEPTGAPAEGEPFADEMMVMVHFGGKLLNRGLLSHIDMAILCQHIAASGCCLGHHVKRIEKTVGHRLLIALHSVHGDILLPRDLFQNFSAITRNAGLLRKQMGNRSTAAAVLSFNCNIPAFHFESPFFKMLDRTGCCKVLRRSPLC